VIEPSSGRFRQVNGEELDDEGIVDHPALPAHEAVVLQPNIGIGFAVVLDDVVGLPKILREACVTHVAPERFRPWPLGAKAAPFSIAAPTVMNVAHTVLSACPFAPLPHVSLTACRWLGRLLGWSGQRQDRARTGEHTVPAAGCSI
jgi:hypothetical protein